jgi:hypothetical protein
MIYLVIDACFGGTGIRDRYNGGYIKPEELSLGNNTIAVLEEWLIKYNNEFFNGYDNSTVISRLDNEGLKISLEISKELKDTAKIEYFSDAKMKILQSFFN